jgi:hypothetical protein
MFLDKYKMMDNVQKYNICTDSGIVGNDVFYSVLAKLL